MKLGAVGIGIIQLAFLVFLADCTAIRAAAVDTRVHVLLWFDTEDYLLPADDDAVKRLCDLLSERGIRATFKMVGEKARVLERRGRQDVIDALKKHDIGYHTDLHSAHPTPTEYLAECGWLEGIDEFVRREGQGAADVRRIFGVSTLSCYGQPGSSWGPQAFGAFQRMGVAPCYVDESDHVGLEDKPFRYAGALNVFHMGANVTRMDLHHASAIEPARKKVNAIADRLKQQGGGLISIYYHPCEWVHKEFWDAVNFSRGANPPREQWKAPPQLSAEETQHAFLQFESYIDHIRSIPGIDWVAASKLPVLYPDMAVEEGISRADLIELSRRIWEAKKEGIDYRILNSRAYSPADQFELLARALAETIDGREICFPLKTTGIFGPESGPPQGKTPSRLGWFAFRDAVKDVHGFFRTSGRMPSRVFAGSEMITPAEFLLAMAWAWNSCCETGKLPVGTDIPLAGTARVMTERHVAEDVPGLFGGWVIHKEGFRAPKLMELARLQAWTLKPAVLKSTAP